jgi:hypothetical protein
LQVLTSGVLEFEELQEFKERNQEPESRSQEARAVGLMLGREPPVFTFLSQTHHRARCRQVLRQALKRLHCRHESQRSSWLLDSGSRLPILELLQLLELLNSLSYFHAKQSAPQTMRHTPRLSRTESRSPRKSTEITMATTTLSLSIGATFATSPICKARK